ncbi:MAG: aspartate aminotransferase family protein [Leptolyngbya sp. SIOISBB]|nr:aspartate aminotransferase family protein [Leptolyngbya sp. SIOISBB]
MSIPSNSSLNTIPASWRQHFTPRQQAHLDELITRYTQRTRTSKQYIQTHRDHLADPRVSFGFMMPLKELAYPIVGERSHGSRIWDVDSNEYLDLIMGFGVNLFGHNPSFVRDAIQAQLEKGIHLGTQTEQIGEVAALICELTGVERVAFSNTGTEAIMTAMRLARAATGRPKIALFANSYHGHFDGTLIRRADQTDFLIPITPGISSAISSEVLVLEYGSERSLDIIRANLKELAAVLVEPVQSAQLDLQPQAFLQELRQITAESGIVLIFDEMVSGFRIHPGGAQAWFNVEADLVTYGKIVGGGLPIGIIAGKAEIMNWLDGGSWQFGDESAPEHPTTFFAGTYCKHPLVIAAAQAVLQQIKAESAVLQNQLNQRTAHLVDELNQIFEVNGLPFRMAHFGSLFGTVSLGGSHQSHGAKSDNLAAIGLSLLRYHLLDQGILLRGTGGFLSTAHTSEDINTLVQAVGTGIENLQDGSFLPKP